MERLTYVKNPKLWHTGHHPTKYSSLKSFQEVVDRLAYYEDLAEQGCFVALPCSIGTHLWKVTHPYRQEPKVTEFVVKNFRTAGKRHQLQLEVQAVNVPGTNWMPFTAFKRTREEAENELKGGQKNATT